MNEIKKNMIQKLEEQFSSPEELNKRQISIFVQPNLLKELDTITEKVKEISNKKITRNYLIELAIETLIESAPAALQNYKTKNKIVEEEFFDLVVYPCDITGTETFERTKSWFYVRADKNKIAKLKYIALYTTSPVQAITEYGEIDHYEEKDFDGKIKYIYYIKGDPIKLKNPIPLGSSDPQSTRSPKYTTLKKLKTVKEFSDL